MTYSGTTSEIWSIIGHAITSNSTPCCLPRFSQRRSKAVLNGTIATAFNSHLITVNKNKTCTAALLVYSLGNSQVLSLAYACRLLGSNVGSTDE